jgi:D-alanine-D-alanine ligase
MLLSRQEFIQSNEEAIRKVEQQFKYPFIAKPVDDGCSSAVVMIKDSAQFNDYLSAIFRREEDLSQDLRNKLRLGPNDEFPNKLEVLIEELITKSDAKHFLEITGGLLTHHTNNGIEFEVFEPSEALAGGEILSLEEKFLAGEGQNLTPARFGDDYETIATKVKADLERVARILHVEGYARIDAFVRIYDDNRVETIIIEVNSLPGMTPATCIFHQSAINGYKPYHFINQILQYALNE